MTYGTPTWIWSVVVGVALYVRGYNGQDSRWYQAAVRQGAGRITAAGITKEVTFEPVDDPIRSYRRRLPEEVSRQPVPESDDRRTRPLGGREDHAAVIQRWSGRMVSLVKVTPSGIDTG